MTRPNAKPGREAGLRRVQDYHSLASPSGAARYALAGALRAFFSSDLTAVGVVVAAAARVTRFGFSAVAGAGAAAFRPNPIDFARAERVAA